MAKRRIQLKNILLVLIFFLVGTSQGIAEDKTPTTRVRIVYPKNTKLQFEGLNIEGELKNPGEFYFQHRREEKFDSLLDRRKNFHREMLRDVVMSR